jgi:hypothetical protein
LFRNDFGGGVLGANKRGFGRSSLLERLDGGTGGGVETSGTTGWFAAFSLKK